MDEKIPRDGLEISTILNELFQKEGVMIIATPNFFKNRIGAIILTIFFIIIFFYIAAQSSEKWFLIYYPIISILFLLRLYLIDIKNTIYEFYRKN